MLKLFLRRMVVFGWLMLSAQASWAQGWGVAMSAGHGTHGIDAYRLELAKDYGPWIGTQAPWALHFIWEHGIGRWRSAAKWASWGPHTVGFISTGPMLRLKKNQPFLFMIPYLEAGIAPSLLTEKKIGLRTLGIPFQFEDKIGMGLLMGRGHSFDLKFRLYHYSNGSLSAQNSGINLYMVSLGFWLPTN